MSSRSLTTEGTRSIPAERAAATVRWPVTISKRPPTRGRSSTGSTTPTAWMAARVASRGAWPTRSGSQPSSISPTSTWSIELEVLGASHCSRRRRRADAAGLAGRAAPAHGDARRMTAPRRRHGRGLVIAFAVVAVLAVLAVVGGGLVLYGRTQLEAPSATHGAAVTVQVQSGETVDQLAADLQTRGLIRSSFWFGWFAKFKGLASQLRAGQFKLDSGMG